MNAPNQNDTISPEQVLKQELELQAGEHIADIGCGGAAHFSFAAAKIVTSTGQVHAVDVLKKALSAVDERAKADKVNNIKTHWSDIECYGALKINDSTLDKVLISNTLFQIKDRAGAIREAARLLKSGGKLMIIDWLPGRFFIGPSAQAKISADEVRNIANDLRLKEIKEFTPGQHHYGLIFEK